MTESTVDWVYPYLPPVFAILALLSSTAEDKFFARRAADLISCRRMSTDYTQTVASVAVTAASMKDCIGSAIAGVLTIMIVIGEWPAALRFVAACCVLLLLLAYLRWTVFRVFALQLDEGTNRCPARRGFWRFSYSQAFMYEQLVFNLLLLGAIALGRALQRGFPSPDAPG